YNTPATCPPTSYSNWFKSTCPDAYSYAYDDTTSTYTCTGASYTINWAGAGSTGGGGTTATPTPTPATGGGGGTSGSVTAYQHCDYGGWSSGLGVGAYDLDLLQNNMGFRNDDMSSVRISSGYEVTMYWDHHFLGSTLTKTGDDNCLVNEGWNDQVSSIKVARKFEAEAWVAMSGVQTEGCSEGGSNVGWIDAGDWIAYPSAYYHAGTFIIEYRVASLNGGGTVSADLNGGSIQLGSRSIPSTGGWQNWTTVTQTVNIPEGTYALGIYASAGGWNVNWIRVRPQ
ncbi:MAG: carbohydrate-binding protein, partial [Spirochaetales bacterium]|nr:carbohydrate-binding protein [Spirochaetales bacterium]